jgi:hypothetical protein
MADSWAAGAEWMAENGLLASAAMDTDAMGSLSESAGRAYTMLLALERLDRLGRRGEPLEFLVLGPDAREGANECELARTFEPLAQALLARLADASLPAPELELALVLVGPSLPWTGSFERTVRAAAPGSGSARVRFTCVARMLHESECIPACARPFACAFAFNAGLWGYDSWAQTLHALGRLRPAVPLVVTSYNELEADEDEGALEGMGLDEHRDWRWTHEPNPFGSTREWQNSLGRTASDNGWWQCVSDCAHVAGGSSLVQS